MSATIRADSPVSLTIVYRPPPSRRNGLTKGQFMEEFEEFVSQLALCPGPMIIVGDFNIHCDQSNDPEAMAFNGLLQAYGLQQHIQEHTHRAGHTLDLVIARDTDTIIKASHVKPNLTEKFDHHTIFCTLSLDHRPTSLAPVMYRQWKGVAPAALAADIASGLCTSASDAETLLTSLNATLLQAADKHAPLKQRRLRTRPAKPWYTAEIHAARLLRRRLETRWTKSGLEVDKQMYSDQCRSVVRLIDQAKAQFYRSKLSSASPRDMHKILNTLMKPQQRVLPSDVSDVDLARQFSAFFHDKVAGIRRALDSAVVGSVPDPEHVKPPPFSSWTPVSEEEIRKLIVSSPSKSSALDAIPAWLLKSEPILTAVLPHLTSLVNSSLSSGHFPSVMKGALVTPILKKAGLDQNNLKHYRPISNLPCTAKLLERVAVKQLSDHMTQHGLHEPFQSAYRAGHSTETALLRVKADFDIAVDEGSGVVLVMLDLSAAFDTLDHKILLDRLSSWVGTSGPVHDWFVSYLDARSQTVDIGGARSSPTELSIGVPQGSVMGPAMFSVYILPLGAILRKHGICFHGYADDTQLYTRFSLRDPDSLKEAIARLERCLEEVRAWMLHNKLKLNDDKSELLIVAPRYYHDWISAAHPQVKIGDITIRPSATVRNLGVVLDSEMSMISQISALSRRANFYLRSISRIRGHLDNDTCAAAVRALVVSRLDYGNALLYGAPVSSLQRLQTTQNNAARLVTKTPMGDHITHVLQRLHWLPVRQRIVFRILSLTYTIIHSDSAPAYLKDLIQPHMPTRNLRSGSSGTLLTVPRARKCVGDRAFNICAPRLWNSLTQRFHVAPDF